MTAPILLERNGYRVTKLSATRVQLEAWTDMRWHPIATTDIANRQCWSQWCERKPLAKIASAAAHEAVKAVAQ